MPGALNSGWCAQFLAWPFAAKGKSGSDLLLEVLADPDVPVSRLVGHSKGCADLARALQALEQTGWPAHLEPAVITIGGVVQLPRRLKNVRQLLGEYDWLVQRPESSSLLSVGGEVL